MSPCQRGGVGGEEEAERERETSLVICGSTVPGLVVGHTCTRAPTQALTRRKSVPQPWEVRDMATGEAG